MNKNIFDHEWGDLPIIFTSATVTNAKCWQITPRVTKNVINDKPYSIMYFLHALFSF